MGEFVEPTEMARSLGVTPKRLRDWLRAGRDAEHPLLSSDLHGSRWVFSRVDADQLMAEFRAWDGRGAGGAPGHRSDSAVQRRAEEVIRGLLAERLGVQLAPRTVELPGGEPVQVDAASSDLAVIAEIFARQGTLKGGQQKKVPIDTLKLITVRVECPDARPALAFADKDAAAYATGRGWLAQALRTWAVDVHVIQIPEELREEIRR